METTCKCARILYMYSRLQEGYVLQPKSVEIEFNVTRRTIQRDIDELRAFYANMGTREGYYRMVEFDKDAGGYVLKKIA